MVKCSATCNGEYKMWNTVALFVMTLYSYSSVVHNQFVFIL